MGWVAGFLARDLPGQQLDLSPLADTAIPVLLIVDYAETRSDQLIRLVSIAWGAADIPPIRMLLLARSAGEWWDQLRRDHPDALGSATVSALPALDRDPPSRRKAFAGAVTAFAHALTTVEPDFGWSLGQILADVGADAEAPLDVLIQIQEAIPSETVVLARASVILTRRIVEALPDGIDPAQRADWTDRLGERLSKAGKPDQALPAAQQAVAIYRELASTDPHQYRPDLADALDNLGIRYSALGRPR